MLLQIRDVGKVWFWKTLRWFFASLMIAPLAALVLGIGVQITQGTVTGAGDQTAAAVGTAVVGCILILIGAICPLIFGLIVASCRAAIVPTTSIGCAIGSIDAFATRTLTTGFVSDSSAPWQAARRRIATTARTTGFYV